MQILAEVIMLAWIPAVLFLFVVLPPRRAVVVAFLVGFLFLPVINYKLPVIPDYTKMSATCVGILLGALCFDSKRVLSFVPRWIDLPMAVFCFWPVATSLANNLGLWDGLSAALVNIFTWGFPYLIGRVYFKDLADVKELALGIFIGGVIYIPLCIFEMRMSPQLHNLLYGFQARLIQVRFEGWRPSVFLDGGLQLGMWMSLASLSGLWLWWTGAIKQVAGVPAGWLVGALLITTILCRSTGALAIEAMALGAMLFSRVTGTRLALIVMLLVAPLYLGLRITGAWHGEQITAAAEKMDPARAQSFQFRIDNEDRLIARALQQPVFGWGGWGRSRIYDEWGNDISITDGLWIIELGTHGMVGLVALYLFMSIPLATIVWKYPALQLTSAKLAPALILAIGVTMFAIDCLPNGMLNPICILAAGAIVGVVSTKQAAFESTSIRQEFKRNRAIAPRRLHPGSF